MGVDHPGAAMPLSALLREVRRAVKQTIQNASIGRAGIRVYDGGWITIENGGLDIEGTAQVVGLLTGNGTLDWFGPWKLRGVGLISGDVDGTGTLDWTGTAYFKGPTGIQGNFAVSGQTTLSGDVTLNSDLAIGSGRIVAGPLVIDRLGPQAGRIASSSVLVLDAGNAIALRANTIVSGVLVADGLDVDGPKNFRMDHPTKPGHWLRHGSTESPVSGTEYTGRVKLGSDGSAVVALPDYFEGLNKPEGRTVQLTPVGRPFPVGADDVVNGQFTVYGTAGRELFWLVKAERVGGDFLLEEPLPPDVDEEG